MLGYYIYVRAYTQESKKYSFFWRIIMKIMKKLLFTLFAVVLCLGVFSFAGCGEEEATAYTIYVEDANGDAIEGVQIGICTYDESTGEKGNCLQPKTTDANGKVVLNADQAVYALNTDLFESEYSAQDHYIFKAYGDYTVVLIAK